MRLTKLLPALIALLMAVVSVYSQQPEGERPSPLAIANLRYKDTYVKITYSQPKKYGREIFGKLVPYGKVWRTGANEAAEITTTKNITLHGFLLKAGTYSIFTIPDKDKWTIIINSELGLWGSYNHNPKLDILRFDVPVQTSAETFESFTISLDPHSESADMWFRWDNVRVSIPIKFLN